LGSVLTLGQVLALQWEVEQEMAEGEREKHLEVGQHYVTTSSGSVS
jgi:hypothetical protein